MDLHIHTCMSPCGDPKSVPTAIVASALAAGMDAVAVCDHNGSENAASVQAAAERAAEAGMVTGSGGPLVVFGGMEITTKSEIHVLGIFDDGDNLAEMQELVYANLSGTNDSDAFGSQYIVDAEDYVTGYNHHLLIGAADLDVEEVVQAILDRGGLAVASHVDRPAFGIISQLGFIPPELPLDAVELSRNYKSSPFSLEGIAYPKVTSSDAHSPDEVGAAWTEFLVKEATVEEIRMALEGREGRKITIGPGAGS